MDEAQVRRASRSNGFSDAVEEAFVKEGRLEEVLVTGHVIADDDIAGGRPNSLDQRHQRLREGLARGSVPARVAHDYGEGWETGAGSEFGAAQDVVNEEAVDAAVTVLDWHGLNRLSLMENDQAMTKR